MSIFIPFIILSIWSHILLLKFNINLHKSFLFTIFITIFYLIFFGKIGILSTSINLLQILTGFIIIFLIFKKKIEKKNIKNIFFIFLIYCFLIWICKDLFYYKYDEFSEYGITTKLIFSENNVPSNIEYLRKGSHHKINFISYFQYFFLKNSTQIFQENISYLANSFFILILLLNIFDFMKIKNIEKLLIFFIFYFLIYTLGPGLDRLYLDSIVGLIIALLLLIAFKENKQKSDYYLIYLLALILPMIKPNGILIIIGIVPIIFIQNFLNKKFIVYSVIILSLISYHLVSKFYISNINLNFNFNNKMNKNYDVHESQAFNFNQVHQLDAVKRHAFNLDDEFINKFSNKQLYYLLKNGIYHSETFLIFNKLFSKMNLNFKLIQIPLNIFIWFSLIILITYFINLREKSKNLYWISILYLGFICSYYLMLIFWGIKHGLITSNFEMKVSWERHLGSLIMGIIFFLLIKFFQIYKSKKIIIFILFLTLCISLPNSLRLFIPKEIISNEIFWKNKIEQRNKISLISQEINPKFIDYSNILLAFDKNDDPYFEPILKYELIKQNITNIDDGTNIKFILKNIHDVSLGNNKIYIIKDNKYKFNKIKNKLKNISNGIFDIDKISLIKIYHSNELNIYELIFKN